MSSPLSATKVIEAMEDVVGQLVKVVSDLDPVDYEKQSACTDWSVAQVLSHLGSGVEITSAGLEAALAGKTLPEDFNQAVWDRWNALSPTEMVAGYIEHDTAYLHQLNHLTPGERSTMLPLSFMPEPVDLGFWCMLRLRELTFHAWDVLVSFDPTAALHPSGVQQLIEWPFPFFSYIAHPDQIDKRADLRLELHDPKAVFTLAIGDTVICGPESTGTHGTFSAASESWLRLTAGRLKPEHTPDDVVVEGPISLDELRQVFPGS